MHERLRSSQPFHQDEAWCLFWTWFRIVFEFGPRSTYNEICEQSVWSFLAGAALGLDRSRLVLSFEVCWWPLTWHAVVSSHSIIDSIPLKKEVDSSHLELKCNHAAHNPSNKTWLVGCCLLEVVLLLSLSLRLESLPSIHSFVRLSISLSIYLIAYPSTNTGVESWTRQMVTSPWISSVQHPMKHITKLMSKWRVHFVFHQILSIHPLEFDQLEWFFFLRVLARCNLASEWVSVSIARYKGS